MKAVKRHFNKIKKALNYAYDKEVVEEYYGKHLRSVEKFIDKHSANKKLADRDIPMKVIEVKIGIGTYGIACPKCGNVVIENSVDCYCPYCGQALKGSNH